MSNQAPELVGTSADYERILELLRERDGLLKEYVAARQFSDEQYADWSRATWKNYARNQLALLRAVRPLTYTDYRHRVTILSPTLGVVSNDRLVTGWMLDADAAARVEAEAENDAKEFAMLASFVDEEAAQPVPGVMVAVEDLPMPALPLVVEPEPEPLPPVVEEPLLRVEQYHAAPDFEGVFLAPTATVKEIGQLLDALLISDEKFYDVADDTTLGELYHRKRALLLARSPAPGSAGVPPVDEANRLAAVELRKRNRAKLQAHRPDLADTLSAPLNPNQE